MTGHLRRRADAWAIVVDLPRGVGGKRRRKWRTFKGTKRQAQAELTRLLGEINKGEYIEPSKETVGAYLNRSLISKATSQARPSTATKRSLPNI
jgi:hypothetical protein